MFKYLLLILFIIPVSMLCGHFSINWDFGFAASQKEKIVFRDEHHEPLNYQTQFKGNQRLSVDLGLGTDTFQYGLSPSIGISPLTTGLNAYLKYCYAIKDVEEDEDEIPFLSEVYFKGEIGCNPLMEIFSDNHASYHYSGKTFQLRSSVGIQLVSVISVNVGYTYMFGSSHLYDDNLVGSPPQGLARFTLGYPYISLSFGK